MTVPLKIIACYNKRFSMHHKNTNKRSKVQWVFLLGAVVVVIMVCLWGAGIFSKKTSVTQESSVRQYKVQNENTVNNTNNTNNTNTAMPLLDLVWSELEKVSSGVFVYVYDEKTKDNVTSHNTEIISHLTGWTGLLIGPSGDGPFYDYNPFKVQRVNCIIGPEEGGVQKNTNNTKTSQRLLQNVLADYRLKSDFDLLILDNAGLQWEAIKNLNLEKWRPRYLLLDVAKPRTDSQYSHLKRYLASSGYYVILIDQAYVLWSREITADQETENENIEDDKFIFKRDEKYQQYERYENYEQFTNLIDGFCKQDAEFVQFKQYEFIENITQEQGYRYLQEIERELMSNMDIPWEAIGKNDDIGTPVLYQYPVPQKNITGEMQHVNKNISPKTLQYTCLALKFFQHLQGLGIYQTDIIELGGGYGGQCYVMYQIAAKYNISITSYTIFDLPEVSLLQQKYLTQLMATDEIYNIYYHNPWQKHISLPHNNNKNNTTLFSANTLAELSDLNQEFYYRLLVSSVDHGYVVWNSDKEIPENFYNITQGKDKVKVVEDRPKFHTVNYVIQW